MNRWQYRFAKLPSKISCKIHLPTAIFRPTISPEANSKLPMFACCVCNAFYTMHFDNHFDGWKWYKSRQTNFVNYGFIHTTGSSTELCMYGKRSDAFHLPYVKWCEPSRLHTHRQPFRHWTPLQLSQCACKREIYIYFGAHHVIQRFIQRNSCLPFLFLNKHTINTLTGQAKHAHTNTTAEEKNAPHIHKCAECCWLRLFF